MKKQKWSATVTSVSVFVVGLVAFASNVFELRDRYYKAIFNECVYRLDMPDTRDLPAQPSTGENFGNEPLLYSVNKGCPVKDTVHSDFFASDSNADIREQIKSDAPGSWLPLVNFTAGERISVSFGREHFRQHYAVTANGTGRPRVVEFHWPESKANMFTVRQAAK